MNDKDQLLRIGFYQEKPSKEIIESVNIELFTDYFLSSVIFNNVTGPVSDIFNIRIPSVMERSRDSIMRNYKFV